MSVYSVNVSDERDATLDGFRPALRGTRHMLVSGNYLASMAGFQVLEAGGNAIDAGVAAGIALGVVHSDLVNFAGVAPIIIYSAARDEVVTISGLGGWPKAITPDYFLKHHEGRIPDGLLRTVVPAAPAAWIKALKEFGNLSFGEVASPAIRLARDGFAMYPLMAHLISSQAEGYARWRSSAEIYLPGGEPPAVGDKFVQSDLAATLQYMADQEAGVKTRDGGLQAAHDAFYRGDIAAAIVRYHAENGGLLTAKDLAAFDAPLEAPVSVPYRGVDVYGCGPWCQGPALLQSLALLKGFDLKAMGHNSEQYIHTVVEAIKLSFADRERYYGDPRFVDVPMDALLSDAYNDRRRTEIKADEAWPGLPPAGELSALQMGTMPPPDETLAEAPGAPETAPLDTSYVCVADAEGNVFSATPSDTSFDTPVIPGLGICPSSRGAQSWGDPRHASSVAPGKRPRLTPNPALAIAKGRFIMPMGSPGGDVQTQAMLQVLLNIVEFDMGPQEAVEAARFGSASFPNSFEPHAYTPGKLFLERRVGVAAGEELAALGHGVTWWPEMVWRAGAVCLLMREFGSGLMTGAADPRRPAYALGW